MTRVKKVGDKLGRTGLAKTVVGDRRGYGGQANQRRPVPLEGRQIEQRSAARIMGPVQEGQKPLTGVCRVGKDTDYTRDNDQGPEDSGRI